MWVVESSRFSDWRPAGIASSLYLVLLILQKTYFIIFLYYYYVNINLKSKYQYYWIPLWVSSMKPVPQLQHLLVFSVWTKSVQESILVLEVQSECTGTPAKTGLHIKWLWRPTWALCVSTEYSFILTVTIKYWPFQAAKDRESIPVWHLHQGRLQI